MRKTNPIAQQDTEIHITDWRKNGKEHFLCYLNEYEGTECFSVRVHVETDDGTLTPTKKGVTSSVKQLPKLIEALQRAEKVARETGRLT